MSERFSKLTENDSIFDGFMHRPFNPDCDGYLNELMPHPPVVDMANGIPDLYGEVNRLREENWRLKKRMDDLDGLLPKPLTAWHGR